MIGHTKAGHPIYLDKLQRALRAHNARKENPSFNESWNEANSLGDSIHRGIISQVAASKYGMEYCNTSGIPGRPSGKYKVNMVEVTMFLCLNSLSF